MLPPVEMHVYYYDAGLRDDYIIMMYLPVQLCLLSWMF
jgi:hypothetical protein